MKNWLRKLYNPSRLRRDTWKILPKRPLGRSSVNVTRKWRLSISIRHFAKWMSGYLRPVLDRAFLKPSSSTAHNVFRVDLLSASQARLRSELKVFFGISIAISLLSFTWILYQNPVRKLTIIFLRLKVLLQAFSEPLSSDMALHCT